MKLLRFLIVLALLAVGCSPAAQPVKTENEPAVPPAAAPTPASANRAEFENYTAVFQMDFDGPVKWQYRLETRRAGALRENSLHIQGVDKAKNPGDVRIVTDGTTTWMTGPGVENECVLFPSDAGLDPSLVYPEDLIPIPELAAAMQMVREETFAGQPSRYYRGGPLVLGGWQDAQVEMRQSKDGDALLQFAMLAAGADPVFGAGAGSMMASYTVESLDPPQIEPVQGCEIGAPLPEDAFDLVRLPGMASFRTKQTVEAVAALYQAQLPGQGWAEKTPPATVDGKTQLSYARNDEGLEIQIEPHAEGGASVTLIFLSAGGI